MLLARDFFALEGQVREIDENDFFNLISPPTNEIRDCIYTPDTLSGRNLPRKSRVKGISFLNVSFTRTVIKGFEFNECKFTRCLFIGTLFIECRFSNCHFADSNTFRAEFRNVYIDPSSFKFCLDKKRHQNIGVFLYQELLRNSREQSQPDFADKAHYLFRRWQRFLLKSEAERALPGSSVNLSKNALVVLYWIFELTAGSGARLSNLLISSVTLIVALTLLNWYFREALGLRSNGTSIHSWVDAFYFSTVTVTTVGFGDITPTTCIGRLVVSVEAMLGFLLLATLASMIFRRIST